MLKRNSMQVICVPSYWQSKSDHSIYHWEYNEIFSLLKEVGIGNIYLLLTVKSDGKYANDYIESNDGSQPPTSARTIYELFVWLKDNSLILTEYDILLTNGTRLKSYYGGDVIAFRLPKKVFSNIFKKTITPAEDNVLYQLDHNNKWKKVDGKIYSIEDYLCNNEDKFFKILME